MMNHVLPPTDITLNDRELHDLEMLLMGAFAPLNGYMTSDAYFSVLDQMRLPSGEVFPMPIVLPVPHSSCRPVDQNSPPSSIIVNLRDPFGTILGKLTVSDIYQPDLRREMEAVLGTTDPAHPYVQYLSRQHVDCYYLGGAITAVSPIQHFDFHDLRPTAGQVREMLAKEGWTNVVGFQTRNPMHRSHFELTMEALREVGVAGKDSLLLLTPAVGPTQPGDVDYHIRVRCYKKILPRYPSGAVKLVLLPLAMRMAGPREAVFHAIIRRNFGCTHFVVGRDHAGPSSKRADGTPFYGPYDAHELLKSIEGEVGIKPIFGRNMMYCGEDAGYLQENAVPANKIPMSISGTEFRRIMAAADPVPDWFCFPEVVSELRKFYKPNSSRGFCVYFTGLPCAGKSTLAMAVEAALRENEAEEREVTLLDADIIRLHLSKGLGFSKQDRQLNVRRIGYVASEIVRHGGVCLVANIAPYEEDRQYNRKLISQLGGYLEVYVSTPLEVCESRDVKELYKKARQGVIQQFTGISDPYEVPASPELAIDSSTQVHDKVDQVMAMLRTGGWVVKA